MARKTEDIRNRDGGEWKIDMSASIWEKHLMTYQNYDNGRSKCCLQVLSSGVVSISTPYDSSEYAYTAAI